MALNRQFEGEVEVVVHLGARGADDVDESLFQKGDDHAAAHAPGYARARDSQPDGVIVLDHSFCYSVAPR